MAITSGDLGGMSQAAFHINDAATTIDGIRNAVNGVIAGTAGHYQTPAATAFRSAMDDWHLNVQKIIEGLNRIGDTIGANKNTYAAQMEHENISVNRIAAMLNGQ